MNADEPSSDSGVMCRDVRQTLDLVGINHRSRKLRDTSGGLEFFYRVIFIDKILVNLTLNIII